MKILLYIMAIVSNLEYFSGLNFQISKLKHYSEDPAYYSYPSIHVSKYKYPMDQKNSSISVHFHLVINPSSGCPPLLLIRTAHKEMNHHQAKANMLLKNIGGFLQTFCSASNKKNVGNYY